MGSVDSAVWMSEKGSGVDRARGALVGLACGDAVGTTLEFKAPGSFAPIEDMVGGGPFGLEPGAWTDDTSMSLCLGESLLDCDGLDVDDQMRRYVLWWKHGYLSSTGACFDIGVTTRHELQRYLDTGQAISDLVDDERAANGSLMRLAPVPIRWHSDPMTASAKSADSSRPTHPASRPVDACRVLGMVVAGLIGGRSFEEAIAAVASIEPALHPAIDVVARRGWQTKEPPVIRGTGFCVDALEAALWAVDGAVDFGSAVLRAANLGDDADTTAAIAGQIAGARWGITGIPAGWLNRLVSLERIVSLADNLMTAGTGERAKRWAFDDFVHAWWVAPGCLLAGEYPGHHDPAQTARKLAVLVDAGVRTFVDLTTPADGLEPYVQQLDDAARQRQLDLRRIAHPIPDRGTVSDGGYDRILATIAGEIAADRGVYVHCWGGVGRTGTVVGCWLLGLGEDEPVLERLRALRSGSRKADRTCPENASQTQVLARREKPARPI